MPNNQQFIQRAEAARDLKDQLDHMDKDEEQSFQFYEWSPGRTMVDLWSTETGEKISIPFYQAESAIRTVREDGKGYRFTSDPNQAPPATVNDTPCPFHRDSPHRADLEKLGLVLRGEVGCPNNTLASEESAWEHFRTHHREKARRYEAAIERRERAEDRAIQLQQVAAMQSLAGRNAQQDGEPHEKPVRVQRPKES